MNDEQQEFLSGLQLSAVNHFYHIDSDQYEFLGF